MLDHWPQNHKVRALTQFPQLVSKFLLRARYILLLQMMRNQKNQFSLGTPPPWACLLINSSVVKRALSLWSTFPQKTLKRGPGGDIRNPPYFNILEVFQVGQLELITYISGSQSVILGPTTISIALGTCQTYKISGRHSRPTESETLEDGPKESMF